MIMVALLAALAAPVWLGLDELAEYASRLEELASAEPERAREILTERLRQLAVLNGIVLSALALLIIRHGIRGWRGGFMPPKGAWILEGQRTWSGPPAVRIAQFTVTVGALLGVLAMFSSVVLWRLGDTL